MVRTPQQLRATRLFALLCIVNALLATPAYAYIDPGTGTMVLQMMAAAVAAGLFYLRNIRVWVMRHLKLGKRPERADSMVAKHGEKTE
jgi:hypothetical protein